MTLQQLLETLKTQPEQVQFDDVIAVIDATYEYQPAAFRNGEVSNEAGTNQGSCKILCFAKLQGLSEQQTLHCFGDYYRKDVLQNPDGDDHANIRQFMQHGWSGVTFQTQPLTPR